MYKYRSEKKQQLLDHRHLERKKPRCTYKYGSHLIPKHKIRIKTFILKYLKYTEIFHQSFLELKQQ